MSKGSKIACIVVSVLALVNVLFLPVYEIFGGLFPDDAGNFFDIVEDIADGYEMWEYDVFWFYAALFVPNLFIFLGAVIGKRGLVRGFSIVGTIVLVGLIALCIIGSEDPEWVLHPEYGCLACGTWLGLILYIAGIILPKKAAVAAPQQPTYFPYNNQPQPTYMPPQTYTPQPNDVAAQPSVGKTCPACGAEISEDMLFCGSCGASLTTNNG